MKGVARFINRLQTPISPEKIKKAGPLICIQRPTAFEFYCYVSQMKEEDLHEN
jgi:hypothetical protein